MDYIFIISLINSIKEKMFGYADQINRALGIFEHRNNVREHYHCVKEMFELYKTPEQLEQLSKREDLDTICAFDYVRMKQNALSGNGLKMADWHPALHGISEVPKMN